MMICDNCGLIFAGHDALKGLDGYVCPSCHGDEISQAGRCVGCGEYFRLETLMGARCGACQMELKFKFLAGLKRDFMGSFSKMELNWLADHVYPDIVTHLLSKCAENM